MYYRDWIADSLKTIAMLPVHLVMCIYACFAQCLHQLYYDFLNNRKKAVRGK